MFFAAFFGTLYYCGTCPCVARREGSKFLTNLFLWPGLRGRLADNGPAAVAAFRDHPGVRPAAVNTAILLTSGMTITIAHHALKAGNRGISGVARAHLHPRFLCVGLQAEEYMHAYHELT